MMALGSEINKIIESNSDLKTRIILILDKAINQENSFLNTMIVNAETETIEDKLQLLQKPLHQLAGFHQLARK